jgi:hypothetical protein
MASFLLLQSATCMGALKRTSSMPFLAVLGWFPVHPISSKLVHPIIIGDPSELNVF